MCADTGTGVLHGQTMLRSRHVFGPYEMDATPFDVPGEAPSMLTSRHHPELYLQKAGHADLVQTPGGEWYMVHLCGRPLDRCNPPDAPRFANIPRYMLGRETAIQKVYWTEDGWLRLCNGTNLPDAQVPSPELPECPWPVQPAMDDFDLPALSLAWQSLRMPLRDFSLTERPGFLRLYGGNGLGSRFEQSFIAQRLTEVDACIETAVEFRPECYKQMAGLILYYDYDNYIYLHITHDEELGRVVTLLTAENKHYAYPVGYIPVADGPVRLRMVLRNGWVRCCFAVGDGAWQPIGEEMDGSFLSDEACNEGWFTGTMAGICCQDLTGARLAADFDWFRMGE